MAFRIRVRKSATESFIERTRRGRSPGGLGHAGDHALVRDLAQADPAQAELAVVGACPPATAAPIVVTGLVLASALLADDLRCLGHGLPYSFSVPAPLGCGPSSGGASLWGP